VGDGEVFCGVCDVLGDVFCLVFEVPVDLVGGAIDVGGVLAGGVGADPVEGGGEVFKVEHGVGGWIDVGYYSFLSGAIAMFLVHL
jgi:hypothetical protein